MGNLQGVANRGCSIRVGRDTEKEGKGENPTSVIVLDIAQVCGQY